MKNIGIKTQLKLTTLVPVTLVALLFALFYNGHIDTQFMLVKRYQMYIVTLFITFAGFSVAYLIHFFLSRLIYRPISRLRRSMQNILNNSFETPIEVTSRGELGVIEQGCAHLQTHYLQALLEMQHNIEIATADLQNSVELLEEKNIELSLDKKKIEEKSRQTTEFIANMSHEIRTPMNGILGFTNVLLETRLDPLQLDYVKTIKSSAQDLLTIINDILDYSKLDAGKLMMDCIPLDLRACIDEVLVLVAPNAHKKGIDLIPATTPNVPKIVLGDPLRVKQILTNLVSNAVKFTDYGYVLIRTHIEQETETDYTFCISIADTGIGISPEDQSSLFNAYNQGSSNITRRHGGSGLGLVICKKLVEHMKGRLTLRSEIHKGSEFCVYLKFEKLAAYEVEKHQSHRFSNLTVICFDDNPLHLEALCNGLGYWGINCIPVSSFAKLNEALVTHASCDIAFINVNQGCEQQVAQLLRNKSIPWIIISKWFINDYQALGAEALLFKPPNIQKLHDTIETILNQTTVSKKNNNELEMLRHQLRERQPQLLVAEDNPVNRMLFNSLLGDNASIETVDDGIAAVARCEQKKFSVLLLDLQMPKMNGLEAARQIRHQSLLNKDTPIILISANSSDLNQDTLQKAGIQLCIQKPIDEKQLLHHLATLVAKDKTAAINWSMCVEKVSGNKELALEFLTRFVEELEKNRIDFFQLIQQNDLQGLEQAAHKLHGACCFCGVTDLQFHVARIENLAKHATHVDELESAFTQLIQSIDAVIGEYQTSYQALEREIS